MKLIRWTPILGLRIMLILALASMAFGYVVGRKETAEQVQIYSSANSTLMDSLSYYRMLVREKDGEILYWRGEANGCNYKLSRIRRICEE